MEEVIIPWPGWKALRKLGKGGYGTVYLIARGDEQAAMKVITCPQDPGQIEEMILSGYDNESIARKYSSYLDKVRGEYLLMSQMRDCPNIVRCDSLEVLHHKDGIGWDVYIRMELLTPLTERLQQKPFPVSEVIRLGLDLARALSVCERRHIIHRDVKPQNILISAAGAYKLGDFGIARTMERTSSATMIGTYNYMAPEVFLGEQYGQNVDLYSLGLVLYWLLNRRRMPFLPLDRIPAAAEEDNARFRRLKGEALPSPADGSPALKAVVLKACAFRRQDRYASADEMLFDLEKAAEGAVPSYGTEATVPLKNKTETESKPPSSGDGKADRQRDAGKDTSAPHSSGLLQSVINILLAVGVFFIGALLTFSLLQNTGLGNSAVVLGSMLGGFVAAILASRLTKNLGTGAKLLLLAAVIACLLWIRHNNLKESETSEGSAGSGTAAEVVFLSCEGIHSWP